MQDRAALDALMTGSAGGPMVVSAATRQVQAVLDRGLSGGVFGRKERTPEVCSRGPTKQDARAAAHLLVRWCAARVTGRPSTGFAVVHRCPECGAPDHGKPFMAGFPDLHISLAHRPGVVAAAAGWTPVGVDVEVVDPPVPAALLDVLSPAEFAQVRGAANPSSAFRRLWARKECLIKLGVTTLDTLRDIDLAGPSGEVLADGGTATRYGQLHVADWVDGVTGAVVAAASGEPPVRVIFPEA